MIGADDDALQEVVTMTAPQRIQQRRTKGWRMPLNAKSVARPSKWGNSFRIGSTGWIPVGLEVPWSKEPHPPLTREQTVECFRLITQSRLDHDPQYLAELRGFDLACWCPLPEPGQPDICHAAVLLELANGDPS